jgi:hypothetical protein
MNYRRLVLFLFVASAALGGSTAPRSDAAGTPPIATTSTSFLTTAEARQATRREVFRIARRRHEEVEAFHIEWCRRRSSVRVGCRYAMWIPVEWRGMSCVGGVRVVERAANRQGARAWRDCVDEAD